MLNENETRTVDPQSKVACCPPSRHRCSKTLQGTTCHSHGRTTPLGAHWQETRRWSVTPMEHDKRFKARYLGSERCCLKGETGFGRWLMARRMELAPTRKAKKTSKGNLTSCMDDSTHRKGTRHPHCRFWNGSATVLRHRTKHGTSDLLSS